MLVLARKNYRGEIKKVDGWMKIEGVGAAEKSVLRAIIRSVRI